MATHKVCLYASQLAACIGRHKYVKQHDALESVWRRIAPDVYLAALQRNGLHTDEEKVSAIAKSVPAISVALGEADAATPATSAGVTESLAAVASLVSSASIPREDKVLVDRAIRHVLYTGYGTRQESSVLDIIRKEFFFEIIEDPKFHVVEIGEDVSIGGRVDALSADGTVVIEIKNRVSRLFLEPPLYENIQLQAYMYSIPEAESAVLVECLKNHGGNPIVNAITVEKDQEMWHTDIVPRATQFVKCLRTLIGDTAKQDAYMMSKRRATFIKNMLKNQLSGSEKAENMSLG